MQGSKPRLLEFFAGGGMAYAGLRDVFDCVFANDIDPRKCQSYRDNFPSHSIVERDIWDLQPSGTPDADIAWASFPCQDLSLAGARRGLNAPRSGAFWGFWSHIERLDSEGRAPRTIVLENVAGLLSSRMGRDFSTLAETIAAAGYRVGAFVLDAADFVPQSRPRLFIVGRRGRIPPGLTRSTPDPRIHPPRLIAAVSRLEPPAALAWTWWTLPPPPRRNVNLVDVLESAPPPSVWRSAEALAKIMDQLSPLHRERVDAALAAPSVRVGAVYRRIRTEGGRRVQRAEVRYDGLAGCIRTAAGGSSRQLLLISENGRIGLRPLLPSEAARLMGCPDGYRLPASATQAFKLIGDGVCVPTVRWLGEHLLKPLVFSDTAQTLSAA